MRGLLLALMFAVALAGPTRADYNEGVDAYKRGDHAAALREFWPLAERGHVDAQYYLGLMYAKGQGVALDYTQAFMWFDLTADMLSPNENQRNAARERDSLARKMTPAAVARARALARYFVPLPKPETTPKPVSVPTPRRRELANSGSGFTVSKDHVLTNAHVVAECAEVRTKRPGEAAIKAEVMTRDRRNDLALIRSASADSSIARFRDGKSIRQGDAVVAVGFPLHGVLASEANVVTGTVSALAGIRDDSRQLQITAPIQPGNSGGPLLDLSGNVVGIVVSKLDALKVAGITGDIPQNVNFAIKAEIATLFLSSNGIAVETAPSTRDQKPADIGDKAKTFTLLVECWK
jgi:S1-C subfamily serine protease